MSVSNCSSHFLASSRTLFGNGGVDGFRRDIQRQPLVRETHFLGEGGVGLPGGGVAGVDLFHHLVDLLEGEAFGFGLEGVGYVSLCESVEGWRIVMTYD